MIRIGDQLTLILERLNQLQQQNALLSEEIADMKRYQMESNDNIQRLTEDIAQMKEQFKEDVAETKTEIRLFAINATEKCSDQLTTRRSEISNVTNNMMQIVVDLSHVKTQLQRQRAATDNSSAEISRLVVLIKDQLTQEVHNSVGAIQRQLQQLAEDNTTKAGIEQLAREHLQMRLGLQLSVSDVYQQLQQLNETAGQYTYISQSLLYSIFTFKLWDELCSGQPTHVRCCRIFAIVRMKLRSYISIIIY